jgi:D-methionine transport system substrate-binding protein
MFRLGVQSGLEKKGYKVETIEFTDWVTPNLALASKEIDANIFQHTPFLEMFAKGKNVAVSPTITIPTCLDGIYTLRPAKNVEELKQQLKKDDVVVIPNDPTNLGRALDFLQDLEFIKVKSGIAVTEISEKDIIENPYGLVFRTVEAAQAPRTLESAAFSIIHGNYVVAAGLKTSSALAFEHVTQDLLVTVTVRTEDLDKQFVRDYEELIQSEDFRDMIEDPKNEFNQYQRPTWYIEKWHIQE